MRIPLIIEKQPQSGAFFVVYVTPKYHLLRVYQALERHIIDPTH